MSALRERASVAIDTDIGGAIEYCYEQGWTDGLPVVPPEPARVEAMLAMEGRPAETLVASHATTGRAIRLVIMNVFGMVPGVSDLSTQGHPGKYSFCIAGRAEEACAQALTILERTAAST